jgi:hypothetical protein
MAGLIDMIGRREIEPASTVLYAHLGGQPALNAYSALFSLCRHSAARRRRPRPCDNGVVRCPVAAEPNDAIGGRSIA